MCLDCHARAARQAQRRIRVLTLQRDCAIDDGLTPGPLLLAEIEWHRGRQIEAEKHLTTSSLHLTPQGVVSCITAI